MSIRPRRKSAVTLPPLDSLEPGERPRLARMRLQAVSRPLDYDVSSEAYSAFAVDAGISLGRNILIRKRGETVLPRRNRRQVEDNIGTSGHPITRSRIATPLTPRAVRIQMLKVPEWLEAEKVAEWLDGRRAELPSLLTDLDRLLDDEEAGALERYVDNEEMLSGNTRVPRWLGERVDSHVRHSAPLPDEVLEALAGHMEAKRCLSDWRRRVLAVFVAQQLLWEDALTAAQAGLRLGLAGRRKADAWWEAVRDAARDLVRIGY